MIYITNNNDLPDTWLQVRDTIDSLSHYDKGSSTTAGSGSDVSDSVNVEGKAITNFPASGNSEKFTPTDIFGLTGMTSSGRILILGNATDPDEDLLFIISQAKCDDAATPTTGKIVGGGLRQMAIIYKLETNDQIACQNI